MKKIFALSLGCLFLFISWMTFSYMKGTGESFLYPDVYSKVQIQISPEYIGQPLTEINQIAQELGIEVTKIDYNRSEQQKKISVYTSDLQKYADRLKAGILPKADGEYLSSRNNEDRKQVGQISVFSTEREIQLYALSSRRTHVSLEQFQVSSMDETLLNEFVQKINAIDDGAKYQATLVGGEKYVTYTFFDVLEQYGPVFFLLILITTMLALYLVFRELKGETIKKILGYSNKKLVAEFLPRVYVPVSLSMVLLAAIMTAVALFWYNGLTCGVAFFQRYFLLSIAVTALVYVIVFVFHFILISSVQPVGIIKNKFPYKSVLATTYFYKLIIVLILTPMIASAVHLYQQSIAYGNAAERLELLNGYVELPLYSDRMETIEGTYELGEQYKTFFARQNARGAILCDVSYRLEEEANGLETEDIGNHDASPDEENYVYANHMTINYEYLRQNPIYDCNGNQVLFTDETEAVVHVLIPEKFRSHASSLTQQIQDCINTDYYILEDMISDTETAHADRKFQITWVKNNQSYFTYDPEIGMEQNCYIQDAISFVYNNKTICGNVILPAFSNYRVKIPVTLSRQNLEFFQDDITACGLEDSVLVANNCYQRVSDAIYQVEQQLNKQIAFGAAYLIVFVVLVFISALTIIRAESRKLYIMSLLGYSAFRRTLRYGVRSAVFWFGVCMLLYFTTDVGAGIAISICAGSLVLEMLVQTILQTRRGIKQPFD